MRLEFLNENHQKQKKEIKLMNDTGNGFYSLDGAIYKSNIVKYCIRPFAKTIGKLVAKHIRKGNDNKTFQINPDAHLKFLLEEPNPYMSGQMLQEKMAVQLKLNNNAFAYILRDEFGYATGVYPLSASSVDAIYENGILFLLFTINGKATTFPYSDIIHLRQDFSNNDIFGDSPIETLKPLMEIVTTTKKSFMARFKNSRTISWLSKNKNNLNSAEQKLTEFEKSFLFSESKNNILDNSVEVTQDYVLNALLMDDITTKVYNFFSTNEKIIQSKYTSDEWLVYYESEIEPIAKQLSDEYTRKLFSKYERSSGNSIQFDSATLQYASIGTKLNLIQMVDKGLMTPNEWREVLNLSSVEGGDNIIRRTDTTAPEQ
jgi:HK97 family phage portal protein